jgi:hypothetical protein
MTTYITWIKHCSILSSDFREHIALVTQQSMHISDESKVLLVSRCLTYRTPPFLYSLQNLMLYASRTDGWTFWKPSHKFIEKFLCTYLEVKGVSAIFNTYIEEIEGEQCDVWVSMIDIVHNRNGSFSRSVSFFLVN